MDVIIGFGFCVLWWMYMGLIIGFGFCVLWWMYMGLIFALFTAFLCSMLVVYV